MSTKIKQTIIAKKRWLLNRGR